MITGCMVTQEATTDTINVLISRPITSFLVLSCPWVLIVWLEEATTDTLHVGLLADLPLGDDRWLVTQEATTDTLNVDLSPAFLFYPETCSLHLVDSLITYRVWYYM